MPSVHGSLFQPLSSCPASLRLKVSEAGIPWLPRSHLGSDLAQTLSTMGSSPRAMCHVVQHQVLRSD